jgi:hypothetical protein
MDNMNKALRVVVFFVCVTGSHLFAQAPKYSNEFLSIGVGARALAMSGAQVATVNDATAGFWNPAGLAYIKGHLQLALMHNSYFGGIADYDYGSLAVPVDATSTIGFSLIRLGVDDIPDTTELIDPNGQVNYDKVKSFSIADYGFFFTYSKNSKVPGFTYGGSAKVIHRTVGEFAKVWGFGIDLGAQYRKDKWSFGLMGKDVTSTFNAWTYSTEKFQDVFEKTGNEIPKNSLEITLPKLILGTAYTAPLSKKFGLTIAADFDVTFDGQRNVVFSSDPVSIDPHAGFELDYNQFLFFRGGVQNIQQIKDFDNTKYTVAQPNLGIGIKLKNLTIDYALTHVGGNTESLGTVYSNVFSLKLDIHKKPK